MIEKCKVRKFIFNEVSCFQSETLLKLNPLTGLFQRSYLDFEWLFSSFGTLFTDTSRSKEAIRNYGKVLKNQIRRSSFLNLIQLNASNCHLLQTDFGFSKILFKFYKSVMACLNFQNTYFREHLLKAHYCRFENLSISPS